MASLDLAGMIEQRTYKRLDVGDFALLETHTEAEAREALLGYFACPAGKADLDESPHRGRPVPAVVEDLLKGLKFSG
jgi:hypothetical protein